MKNTRNLFSIIFFMMLIYFSMTTCSQPADESSNGGPSGGSPSGGGLPDGGTPIKPDKPQNVDTTALRVLIEEAQTERNSTIQAFSANEVEIGQKWVTYEIMAAFNNAIDSAVEVLNKADNLSATQAEINSAVTALNNALISFRYAQETGISLIFTVIVTDIHPPVFGATPNVTANCETENVTAGTVTWIPTVTSAFAAKTVYTAAVTLTAADGYAFAINLDATINGNNATVTGNAGNSSRTVTLSYAFPETQDKMVTNIAVLTQPDLTYTYGDTPNLSNLVVILTHNDNSSENVGFADFDKYGITTIPEYNEPLSVVAHNGNPIEIWCGNVKANTGNLTINKANPAVTWPAASPITYGAALSASTLSGGAGDGTFAWSHPSTTPPVGNSNNYEVTFTPRDTANFNTLKQFISIFVNQITPGISWPTASPITYGAALSTSMLSGGAGDGTFAWTNGTAIPTVTNGGYEVTFTPTDTANYNTVKQVISITVYKADPTVTWPTASSITYGAALSASTLSGGSGTPAGSFAWSSPHTTPGVNNSGYHVIFTPNDTANYNTLTEIVNITVNKANPTVTTWPTASSITYGAALSASTLSGGSGTPAGSFAWSSPSSIPSAVGTYNYQVTFTTNDTVNYNALTQNVSITVNKANPTVTWPTASSITYGAALSTSTLSGGAGSGAFAWSSPSTIPGNAGSHEYEVTFTPSDTSNYNTLTHNVSITVNKANPTVTTWPTAAPITYGARLNTSTLSGGNANITGTFAWTSGTTIPTVGNSGYEVTFTPTDTANYNTRTQNVSIVVTYSVTFNSNGGSAVTSYSVSTHGATISAPTAPTKTRYTFEGWYKETALTNKWTFGTGGDTVTANITLYAKWTYSAGTPITYVEDVGPYLDTLSTGGAADNPASLPMSINLGTMTAAGSGWRNLLDAIQAKNKYVNLDLSTCTMTGTAFNPDSGYSNGKNRITAIVLPNAATSIQAGTSDNATFKYFTLLTDVTIPNTVTTIGSYAFRGSKLTSVTIPNTVTTIGDYAFADNMLTGVTFTGTSKVTSIGNYVFANNQITSVSIPISVTSIGNYAFYNNQLTLLVGLTMVETIGNYAFANNKITGIIGWSAVTSIGDYAFYGNKLTSVTIPNRVTYIGEKAFAANIDYSGYPNTNGNQLTSVTFTATSKVSYIGSQAFYGNQITSVTIPDSVTSLGDKAFQYNPLTSVVINGSFTTIGQKAFEGYFDEATMSYTGKLTSVTIGSSVTTIDFAAFSGNQLASITIPNNVRYIAGEAFTYNPLTSITIGANVNIQQTPSTNYINPSFPEGFDTLYKNNGKLAGTYTRPNTSSTTWTRQP